MTATGSGAAPLRRLLVAAAAALVPVLAGCQAGDNAPTLSFHYPTDAAGVVAGDLSIRNVFVLGPALGHALAPGQSASLFFALVNTGSPDRLLSITAPGTATSVRLPAGGVPVGTAKTVLLSGPQPQAFLVGLTRPLLGGTNIKLVLTFLKQGPVALEVPVMPRASHYLTYAPPPRATPSPSVTTGRLGRRHHHHLAPTPGVSPSASPSPSRS